MCSIKFLIRQPWAYIVAGIALFILMLFSVYDASRGGSIPPLSELKESTGVIVQVKETSLPTASVKRYELTVKTDGSEQEKVGHIQLPANEQNKIQALAVGASAEYHATVKNTLTFYALKANGVSIIEYQNLAQQAADKAKANQATMTHPIAIIFMLLLVAAGILGEVFKKRQCALHQRFSMEAMDRAGA